MKQKNNNLKNTLGDKITTINGDHEDNDTNTVNDNLPHTLDY